MDKGAFFITAGIAPTTILLLLLDGITITIVATVGRVRAVDCFIIIGMIVTDGGLGMIVGMIVVVVIGMMKVRTRRIAAFHTVSTRRRRVFFRPYITSVAASVVAVVVVTAFRRMMEFTAFIDAATFRSVSTCRAAFFVVDGGCLHLGMMSRFVFGYRYYLI